MVVFLEPNFLTSLVAGLAMLALAGWILYVDFGNRLHQALALLLFFRAGFAGLLAFQDVVGDFAGRFRFYFTIADLFATAYFAFAYWRRYRWKKAGSRMAGAVPWVILGLGLGVETSYLVDHSLRFGLFYPFIPASMAAFALLGLSFAILLPRARGGARERCWFLASVAFILEPTFYGASRATNFLHTVVAGSTKARGFYALATARYELAFEMLAFVAAAAALVVQVRWLRSLPPEAGGSRAATLVAWWTAAVATGAIANLLFEVRSLTDPAMAYLVLRGLWALSFPGLLAYALARHRFLDAHRTAKLTIQRGTILAVFVATFYLASEGSQEILTRAAAGRFHEAAPFIGLLGAGLLVFLLHPLQRAAERLASRTVPSASTLPALGGRDREGLYREHCELAWLDGQLERKERILLDALRARLAIPMSVAADIESAVVRALAEAPKAKPSGRMLPS
ncbi:MAG: hypothetical protein HYT80_08255 [Euryarchaeota archaeon]|nr:hypothetical protein [Euryarchaeota archaeon]